MTDVNETTVETAIIGAGFAGLGTAARLRERGERDFVVLEADVGVGGTWRANTYPGCACDVPSHLYSFSFARSAEWSHDYGRQPEILAYLERFTDERGLRPFIRFETRVDRATWNETTRRWELELAGGERVVARHLIAGTGPLRIPKYPAIPGREAFEGPTMHTARWRSEVELRGKRVAVIGTGASAAQAIPELAKICGQLIVFQRTPPWVLPRRDGPVSEVKKSALRKLPFLSWLARAFIYVVHEVLGTALFAAPRLGALARRKARRHLDEQVTDPVLREKLTPDYGVGCKRILLSNTYYPAMTQPNVEVVNKGVRALEADAVVDADGSRHPVDVIVYATGFDVTGFLAPMEIRGRGGRTLAETWRERAIAHMGITVPGFPNFYLLLGPNTGLGHNSVVFMIESQIRYILGLVDAAREKKEETVEVRPEALETFLGEMERRLGATVWNAGGCRSWYLDERGQNVVLWPGYTTEYWWRTRRPRLGAYRFGDIQRQPETQPPSSRPTTSAV